MSDDNTTLKTLEKHRDNLSGAKSWEEYRDHHVAYVNYCIERQKVLLTGRALAQEFLDSGEAPKLPGQE